MSKRELTKEFLEYEIFEELEPEGWDSERDGLWIPQRKCITFKKGEIDQALKEVEKRMIKMRPPAQA